MIDYKNGGPYLSCQQYHFQDDAFREPDRTAPHQRHHTRPVGGH
jgi:hypothetical protein